MRLTLRLIAALMLLMIATASLRAEGRRRAVLIGINDYTASRFAAHTEPGDRDWPNLRGAVRDAGLLRELLVLLCRFEERDIVVLTNQDATREAILQAIEEQLLRPAEKDDTLFFYFAGHGSQVANSLSGEPDKLDESIVPADSRAGAPDIRDKELRTLFNRILDRGAHLTVMLDNCYSGSGARGLATGALPRSVQPDRHDVHDGTDAGPSPEERGALVLTATHDDGIAQETRDTDGMHGVFSLAWIKAMRDAAAGEPASDTFLRAEARMRAGTPFQEPAMAGTAEARRRPFLGMSVDGRERNVVAVERVMDGTTVLLQGGWANGLAVGSELRTLDGSGAHFAITAMYGLGRSKARLRSRGQLPRAIRGGALLEVIGWAAPPGQPLRLSTPRAPSDVSALAQPLAAIAHERGIRWITDPVEITPHYQLRFADDGWELLQADGKAEHVLPEAALHRIPAGSSLFVQLPARTALIDAIGIERPTSAEDADYILVGRYTAGHVEYAWMRPAMSKADSRGSGLPIRSDWIRNGRYAAARLREAALRLRRIHAWQQLESPPDFRSPYRLALRRTRTRELVRDGTVAGGESYRLVLRGAVAAEDVHPRYFYVFIVDRHGRSYLAFPGGSVENRFPRPDSTNEIALDQIKVRAPYGADTYFLLSTEEPLPDPWILEWDGVRTRDPASLSELETLLMLTASGERAGRTVTPTGWSLERTVYESVPPAVKRRPAKRH